MPMRWMKGETERQVGLGTFEEVVFAHLDRLASDGINCIELLPIQDSPDTLNWGYGTRFFFAPDLDMGTPMDLKWFIKQCHRRGIRVFMDVVMNHSRDCPLARLAKERYFTHREGENDRGEDYGGDMFRYQEMVDGQHWSRLFHLDVANFWINDITLMDSVLMSLKALVLGTLFKNFVTTHGMYSKQNFPIALLLLSLKTLGLELKLLQTMH